MDNLAKHLVSIPISLAALNQHDRVIREECKRLGCWITGQSVQRMFSAICKTGSFHEQHIGTYEGDITIKDVSENDPNLWSEQYIKEYPLTKPIKTHAGYWYIGIEEIEERYEIYLDYAGLCVSDKVEFVFTDPNGVHDEFTFTYEPMIWYPTVRIPWDDLDGEVKIHVKFSLFHTECTFSKKSIQIDHSKAILKKMESIEPDVTLECKDGAEVETHRCVLAAHSDFFAALFSNDWREKNEGRVKLEDFSEDVVTAFVKYLYTCKLEEEEPLTPQLALLADRYQVEPLRSLCETKNFDQLTPENACLQLMLAKRTQNEKVVEQVITFIHENPAAKEHDDFAKLVTHPDLLLRICQAGAKRGIKRKRQD